MAGSHQAKAAPMFPFGGFNITLWAIFYLSRSLSGFKGHLTSSDMGGLRAFTEMDAPRTLILGANFV